MNTKDPIAVVQEAVDLTAAGARLDGLLTQIRNTEAMIETAERRVQDWRIEAGQVLAEVRKAIPLTGPRSGKWGEFVEARGITRQTAGNYMKLAEFIALNPGTPVAEAYQLMGIGTTSGAKGADSQKYFCESLPTANHILDASAPPKKEEDPKPAAARPAGLPPSTNRSDLWRRFLEGKLTGPEHKERKTWGEAQLAEDEEIRKTYQAACKSARKAGRSDPPYPPIPGGWLTAGAQTPAADPAAAAAKAFAAAEELGRANPTKPPLLIGAVVSKLRQAGVLIAPGQDRAVFKAYEGSYAQASLAAARARPAPESAPAADPRQAALPLAEPAPYKPLFDDSPLADDAAEDDDDFDTEDDRDLTPAEDDREDEDELREVADELEGERDRLAAELTRVREELAQAKRDCELAAKAHAQALKTMEGMERELAELRTRLAGAKLAEQVRDELADMVRSLRDEADACGLVTCESEADDGYCGRLALPCSDGPALCRRHQQPGGGGDPGPAKPAKAARGKAKAKAAAAPPAAPRRDPATLTEADLPVSPGLRWEKRGALWHAEPVVLRQMSFLEAFAVGDPVVTGYGCSYRIDGTCGRSGLRVRDARPGMTTSKGGGQLNDLIVLGPGVARDARSPGAKDPTAPIAIPIEDRFVVKVTEEQLSPILAKTLEDWGGDWGNQTAALKELARAALAAAMGAAAASSTCGARGGGGLICERTPDHDGPHATDRGEVTKWYGGEVPAATPAAPTWQPASIGGAQAVHALALGAVAEGDHAHPAALCKQRPNYKSKAGWMPRPGTPLTCKGCIAATTTNEEK